MRKLLYVLFGFIFLAGCKNDQTESQNAEFQELIFNYQKMPKKLEIGTDANDILDKWPEFNEFSKSVDVLYRAKNNEDLVLAIDDLIEKEKLLAKSQHPEIFDKFQIKSRLRVLKTYILKVKASILNHTDTTEPTIQMLTAHNAFRNQFNVVMNNQLDKKLILDEE